jgi:negative regulator of genetic competence, sporulation and motility
VNGFVEWLQKKNEPALKEKTPKRESMAKRKQDMYRYLMSSSESEQDEDAENVQSDPPPRVHYSPPAAEEEELIPNLTRLNFEDVFHGLYPKSCNWWLKVILRCTS